jgi:2-methylcitrate dehydratase PrpD
VARLRRADGDATAAAIDAAAGLALAAPWESALRGSFVRNTWLGAANVAGTVAACLGVAGLADVDGTPDLTLGGLLGELMPEELTVELGTRFDVSWGYFKRHSSCSYTHPPVDAVLAILEDAPLDPATVASVLVETNRLAAPLNGVELPTRLAAMFSIPYVVAVALTEGAVLPEAFDEAHRQDPELRRLMAAVRVRRTDEMDRRLPAERAARVTVTTTDGTTHVRDVPNPVGDADHLPFGWAEVIAKLTRLLGADVVGELVGAVESLTGSDDGGALLGRST